MKYSDYLQKRFDYLQTCDAYIEEKLEDARQDLVRRVNEDELKPQEPPLKQDLFEIEVVTDTFRYSMLVATCTFLEEFIRFITRQLIADYEAKLKDAKRGSWLSKHLELLASCVDLDIKSIERQKIIFEDVILVRNTITHAWGRVEASKSPEKLRAIVSRHDWANISNDGFLVLDDQAVPDAMLAAVEIVENILKLPLTDSIKF